MAWSKSTRISVMLAIDIVFFLLELIVGFVVSSLALMADAFHMLNDIISLLVGLWAVRVADKATTDRYSYGWLRAEILGAFFNAVFLIALCVSIILEALTRFLDPPEISNPELILLVGSLGLASNLAGFLVLGGHGHAHGDEHEHEHGEHNHAEDEGGRHAHSHHDLSAAEEGRAPLGQDQEEDILDQDGRVADLLPAARPETTRHIRFDRRDETWPEALERCGSRPSTTSGGRERRRAHSRLTNIDDLSIHPASFRQDIIDSTRQPLEEDEESGSDDGSDETSVTTDVGPKENTPLISKAGSKGGPNGAGQTYGTRSRSHRSRGDSSLHDHHNHNKPRGPQKSHGHSHGDMGMNAMILHVLGDALGNMGVIATALIIWLTDWPGRFYADPAVSLFITLIILRSALPLTFATSKILLQATPEHIDLREIREDIQALPGVVSCHHVHIWQLSDTKIVASLHIQVAFPVSEEGGEKYMTLAKRARRCLHAYGIHSATIQPEFCLDASHDHGDDTATSPDGPAPATATATGTGTTAVGSSTPAGSHEDLCLLECVDDCVGEGCCSGAGAGSPPQTSHSAHSPATAAAGHRH